MKIITRRTCLKRLVLAAAASGVAPLVLQPFPVFADTEETQHTPTADEAAAIAEIARQTMEKSNAPGLSVAVARHGQFVFQQGYGFAEKAGGKAVTPSSLFRIASVSKPITSVAIFSLIEKGRLGLNDLVFGADGIFKGEYVDFGKDHPDWVTKITIHHLLTHTCGGWDNTGKVQPDPMFSKPALNHRELITWTLRELPLQNEPGTHYSYSNFGFCVLGRVIEKITGRPYAEYAKEAVLSKCGITDMRIGGNTRAERAPEEVTYYGEGRAPYGMNVARMDSHGGWIATPGDLVRFAMYVDGFKTTPNILETASIKAMTTATDQNKTYACGWCVNRYHNWWHNGSLPGTLSIMVRTGSGLCWAAFTNTRVDGLDLDGMMWKMVQAVPTWHA